MNKTLLRVVAFFLIPCLLMDPVSASGFQLTTLRTTGSICPNLEKSHRLDQEALAAFAVFFLDLRAFAISVPRGFASLIFSVHEASNVSMQKETWVPQLGRGIMFAVVIALFA